MCPDLIFSYYVGIVASSVYFASFLSRFVMINKYTDT